MARSPDPGELMSGTSEVRTGRGRSPPTGQFDVFLSHSHADADVVARVAAALKRAGINPWLDAWHVTAGRRWQDDLAEGLRASSSCAVFVGPSDVGVWKREEFHVALNRDANDPGFRVFLVLLPGVPEPFDAGALSPFLSTRTWVDLRRGVAHPVAFRQLLHAVKGIPFGEPTNLQADTDTCPYRGLEAFDEGDTELFFGREAETQRLIEKLKAATFLAVVGPSGSGKSSLTRAGLIPAIRAGALPGSETWAVPLFRPGPHPLDNLAGHLAREIPDLTATKVRDELANDPRTLRLLLSGRPEHDRRVIGVVDQFEEIFTLCNDEHERRMFVLNMLHASTADGPGTVVLTMRADFYPRCAAYPELAQQLASHQFLVGPLDDERLRLVIEEPARQVGLRFEPGLVETILDDVHKEAGALPLLQHALLELWKLRLGDTLTFEGYHKSGGVTGALARRADAVWSDLGATERDTARRVMLRLTQPGEGTEDTRRRAAEAELISGADAPAAVERVVQALTDARLLTASVDAETGYRLIDVTHEALIRGWPQLRQWIDEDREGLREHRRLAQAATEWRELGRDQGALYRGARLAAAAEWADGHRERLNDLEREFLDASLAAERRELEEERQRAERERLRAEKEARAARRFRLLSRGLAALLILAVGTTVWAIIASRRATNLARTTVAAAASAQAVELAETEGGLALQLALEAYQTDQTPEVRSGLLQTKATTARIDAVLRGHEGSVNTVEASPIAHAWDGDRLVPRRNGPIHLAVSAGEDGTVRLWDRAAGQAIGRPLEGGQDGAVNTVAISPDGRLLASADVGGRIVVWDVATQRRVGPPLRSHVDEVLTVRFNPRDSDVLASAGADGTVRLWDLQDRQPLVLRANGGLPGQNSDTQTDDVRDVAFRPDGEMFATAGRDGSIQLWTDHGSQLTSPQPAHVGGVTDVEFADDATLVSGGRDGQVRFWNVAGDGRLSERAAGSHDGGRVFAVAASNDGTLAASAGVDGEITVWDVATATRRSLVLPEHQGNVLSLAFEPAGVLLSAAVDGLVVGWDVDGPLPSSLGQSFVGERVATRGGLLVSADADGGLVWRDADSLTQIDASPPVDGRITALASRPVDDGDGMLGSTAVVAYGTDHGRVQAWDEHHDPAGPAFEAGTEVSALAFSPVAPLLVAADWTTGRVAVYDLAREQILTTFGAHPNVRDLDVSPDGALVAAAGGDARVRLWDLREHGPAQLLPPDATTPGANVGHTQWVVAVAFSPDGEVIATGSLDGTIILWDVATRRPVSRPLQSERGRVTAVVFSPDGQTLASATDTGAVELWDVTQPEDARWLVAMDEPHTTWTWGLDFTSAGRLVSAADDGTAVIWRPLVTEHDADRWRAHVCGIVGGPLTRDEWELHLSGVDYRPSCVDSTDAGDGS